jgi:hypothetical protein
LICDTKGNIFGGFTPVKWESRVWNRKTGTENNCRKEDESQESFLFTLKNPHNIPARRFALKADWKHLAIICDFQRGPYFCGIGVSNNCDTNANSGTYLGSAYINDTGLDEKVVFTGSHSFQVKEIEVFEITE